MGTVINPSDWNYLSIFKLLNNEKKDAICLRLLEFVAPMEPLRIELEQRIAKYRNMRPQTISLLPLEGKSKLLSKTILKFPYEFIRLVFEEFHLKRQIQLVKDFLGFLGIDHEEGRFDEENMKVIDTESLSKATDDLLKKKYPEEEVVFYLATLLANAKDIFQNLAIILQKRLTTEAEFSSGEEARRPEESEEFTTLDNHLIRTIVDVAQGIEGALDENQLVDMVEEIIKLNSSRHQSYFHRGYMEGIMERSHDFSFTESNPSRLAWYFTGIIMGLMRRQKETEILELLKAQKRIVDDIAKTQPLDACFKMLAPSLHSMYRRNGMLAQSMAFITKKALAMLNPFFLKDLLEDGAACLREGKTGDADLLISPLYQQMPQIRDRYRDIPFFRIRVARKKGQILQYRGDFTAASEIFRNLIDNLDESDIRGRAYILSDMGLVEGGFKTIAQIKLPSPNNLERFKTALVKGSEYFNKAIELSMDTQNAHYCLGMLEYLRGNFDNAANLLDIALVGMLEDEAAYQSAGILDTCRFVLALSIYEAMDENRFNYASENLKKAFDSGFKPPSNVIKNLLEISGTLLDHDFASYVGRYLYEVCGDKILRHIDLKHIELCDSIRCAVEKLSSDIKTPVSLKWEYNCHLLAYHLSMSDIDKAVEKLDALEVLSVEEPEKSSFLELISHPEKYEPAWDRSDAKFCKIRMLEASGEYNQAAALLTEEFHRLCTDAADQVALQEANDVIDKIVSYGLGKEYTQPLKERLNAILSTVEQETVTVASTGEPFSILFVGGNEKQQRYDAAILGSLAKSNPNLKVDFYHTNWSSNWGDQLEKVKQQLSRKRHNLIIIMKFIRTGLGQRARRLCNDNGLNWYSCTGHGRLAVERAIINGYRLFSGRR